MKPCIVHIDNLAQTRQRARWTLEPAGFEVLGASDGVDVCRCLKAGADAHPTQPVVPLELADVVSHLLEAPGVPE